MAGRQLGFGAGGLERRYSCGGRTSLAKRDILAVCRRFLMQAILLFGADGVGRWSGWVCKRSGLFGNAGIGVVVF
jgi:hypothetical protein